MSAVTLRAARKKSPTRPQKVSRLLTLPKEKTALMATMLLLKPGHRTTAAGDMEPPCSSSFTSPRALFVPIGEARTYIHTVYYHTYYTDSECAQNHTLVN